MSEYNDKLILWTKQGSIAQIETPEIGGAGSVIGTLQFTPGKFGNGSDDQSIDNRRFEYPRDNIPGFDPNAFIIEHWFDTDEWTITNGIPSDAVFHRIFDWYINNNNRVTCQTGISGGGRFEFYVGVNGVGTFLTFTTGITWDSNLHHMIIVWDRLGIDGGPDTFRFYLDTVLVANSTASSNEQTSSGGNLHFHNVFFNGSSLGPWKGLFDNLRIFKQPTESLIAAVKANWQNENPPVDFIPSNAFNSGLNNGLNEAIN